MTRAVLATGLTRTACVLALAAALAAPGGNTAAAEDYPSRTISLVVAFPAGGGVDTVGRVIAQKLTDALGQQVIVINRPGAGSVIGTRDVARAQPDGYTLLLLVTGAGFASAMYAIRSLRLEPANASRILLACAYVGLGLAV